MCRPPATDAQLLVYFIVYGRCPAVMTEPSLFASAFAEWRLTKLEIVFVLRVELMTSRLPGRRCAIELSHRLEIFSI